MKKFAFACSTFYQLMNIITFVEQNLEESRNNSDLFIFVNENNTEDFHNIKQKLVNYRLFTSIYFVNDIIYNKNILKRKIHTLILMQNGKRYIYKNISPILNEGEILIYTTLVVPCATLIFELLKSSINVNDLYFIEDGYGSYIGNVAKSTVTKSHFIFNKIFNRTFVPSCLYLRNIDFFQGSRDVSIKKLPIVNNENTINILSNVFDSFNESNYTNKKFIYLDQPLYEISEVLENDIECLLSRLYEDIHNVMLIRKHPRSTDRKTYLNYEIDKSNIFWEYICFKDITNEHVLIGATSTAMFSPFFLYEKEPYLVFLFDILPFDKEMKINYRNTVNTLIDKYKIKEKIYIPNSVDELVTVINKLKQNI